MVNNNKPIKKGAVVKKATTSKKSNLITDKSAPITTSVVGTSNDKKSRKRYKNDKEENANSF